MDDAATVAAVAINGECEQSRREALIGDGADHHLRDSDHLATSRRLDGTMNQAILVEREMGSRAVV